MVMFCIESVLRSLLPIANIRAMLQRIGEPTELLPSDDVSRANTASSDTSWLRYPYQAQTENVFSDSSSSAKPSKPEPSSRSTPRSGGGFRRLRTPAPGIILSPPALPSAMLARIVF